MTPWDLLLLGSVWGIYAGVFAAHVGLSRDAEAFEWRSRLSTQRNLFR